MLLVGYFEPGLAVQLDMIATGHAALDNFLQRISFNALVVLKMFVRIVVFRLQLSMYGGIKSRKENGQLEWPLGTGAASDQLCGCGEFGRGSRLECFWWLQYLLLLLLLLLL